MKKSAKERQVKERRQDAMKEKMEEKRKARELDYIAPAEPGEEKKKKKKRKKEDGEADEEKVKRRKRKEVDVEA